VNISGSTFPIAQRHPETSLQFGKKYPAAGALLATLLYAISPNSSAFKYKDHQIGKDTVEIMLAAPVKEVDINRMVDYCSRVDALLNGPQQVGKQEVYTCKPKYGPLKKTKIDKLIDEAASFVLKLLLPEIPAGIKKVLVSAPKNTMPLRVQNNRILK
jgi:hypothetical protein